MHAFVLTIWFYVISFLTITDYIDIFIKFHKRGFNLVVYPLCTVIIIASLLIFKKTRRYFVILLFASVVLYPFGFAYNLADDPLLTKLNELLIFSYPFFFVGCFRYWGVLFPRHLLWTKLPTHEAQDLNTLIYYLSYISIERLKYSIVGLILYGSLIALLIWLSNFKRNDVTKIIWTITFGISTQYNKFAVIENYYLRFVCIFTCSIPFLITSSHFVISMLQIARRYF